MFWFDRNNPDVIFMDNRNFIDTLCDGRTFEVKPDVVADGVLVSAASLSPEDCGSECKDHEGITLKEGTYPFQ